MATIGMTNVQEEWRAVPEFEGLYSVSNFGNVFTHARMVMMPNGGSVLRDGRILAGGLVGAKQDRRGVILWNNGARKNFKVAQLVMLAFVGPCPAGLEVCHSNGDAMDDRLSNLRYATHAENMRDATLHGTQIRGERVPTAKLTAEKVRSARADGRGHKLLARIYGISPTAMLSALRGKSWRHV